MEWATKCMRPMDRLNMFLEGPSQAHFPHHQTVPQMALVMCQDHNAQSQPHLHTTPIPVDLHHPSLLLYPKPLHPGTR